MLRRLNDEISQAGQPARAGEMRAGARRRSRAAFLFFIAASVVVPVLLYGFAAYRDWHIVEQEGRDRVRYARDALAEHVLRAFKTQQFVALAIENRMRGRSWDEIAESAELRQFLAEIEAQFPEVHGIWLADAAGVLRTTSRAPPMPGLDVAERDWFREAKGANAGPVAVPRGGDVPGEAFGLAFRRSAEDGSFDGVIRTSVPTQHLAAFHDKLAADTGASAVIRRDGTVLWRAPEAPAMPAGLAADSPLLARIAESDEDLYVARSTVDGQRRVYGYARLGNVPVYVGCGIGEEELVRLWRRRLQASGLYFIPAALALLVLAFYAWRAHDDLEGTVGERTKVLSGAVAEREQLLKEVHHRVKNNMQIITSLIRMQERVGTSSDETIRRVQAMALVHDLIYTQGEFAAVDLAAYSARLVDTLRHGPAHGIAFNLDIQPVSVTLDRAMPFALILSEVVTNAIRHAFKERSGTIAIALSEAEGSARLRVHDDGFGFNPEVDGSGFGLKLVQGLAQQLDATFSFERHQGTTFSMTFPVRTPPA
jgi:two-component sensor histidine kinase